MIRTYDITLHMKFRLHGVSWAVTGGLKENLGERDTVLVRPDGIAYGKERRMLVKTITTAELICH